MRGLALIGLLLAAIWNPAKNRMDKGEGVIITPSSAKTATGDSGWIDSQGYDDLVLELDVTAVSGATPTLNVTVETAEAADGVGARAVNGSPFPQKTAAGNERRSFVGVDNFFRVTWTIGGTTPSFTFSIIGEAS